jgi:hypothetical protein
MRDLVTMLPGAVTFFRMNGPNSRFATADMSNVYLLFLTAYTGYKEFRKWFDLRSADPTKLASQLVVPKDQVVRFRRGEVIVAFWTLLFVVTLVIQAEGLIPRLPKELARVAVQAICIWMGGLFSEGALRSHKQKKADDYANTTSHAQKILDHIDANGAIYNEECQNITGLSSSKAYRLLQRLVSEGELVTDGKNKGKRYFKPGKLPANPPN